LPEKLEHKARCGWAFGLLWEHARALLPPTDQLINLIEYQYHASAWPGFRVRCGTWRARMTPYFTYYDTEITHHAATALIPHRGAATTVRNADVRQNLHF